MREERGREKDRKKKGEKEIIGKERKKEKDEFKKVCLKRVNQIEYFLPEMQFKEKRKRKRKRKRRKLFFFLLSLLFFLLKKVGKKEMTNSCCYDTSRIKILDFIVREREREKEREKERETEGEKLREGFPIQVLFRKIAFLFASHSFKSYVSLPFPLSFSFSLSFLLFPSLSLFLSPISPLHNLV